jgi:hypothetical protein
MKMPFPGMDSYLEQEGVWNQLHLDLITNIRYFLAPLVQPNYKVIIEQLTYTTLISSNGDPKPALAGKPDNLLVSAKGYKPSSSAAVATPAAAKPIPVTLPILDEEIHRYLEIRDKQDEVITVIEILSPVNKQSRGREQYLHKRNNILISLTHLIEIDLLRQGKPLPMEVAEEDDYRIIVSRSQDRPVADAFLFSLREPIPDFPVPLREGDNEPILKLNDILRRVYELGYYKTFVDYNVPLNPPLSDDDLAWVADLIQNSSAS